MKRKTLLIIIILLILTISIILIYPKDKKQIMNTKEEKKNNMLSIMVESEAGTGKYKDATSFPSTGYYLNKKLSKCVNGSKISFSEGNLIIKGSRTDRCYAYFDQKKTIIEILRANDSHGLLSEDIVGGMYRYQGNKDEVNNNYLCFGTDDINKCNCNNEENCDKYMYRIIGVTDSGQLYLIKMKGVVDNNTNIFSWNSKGYSIECDNNICEWPNADLYKRLNGEGSEINQSNIFLNNERYEYLKKDNPWYEKIVDYEWLYGDIGTAYNVELAGEILYGSFNNGLIIYDIEVGLKPTLHKEFVNDSYVNVRYQWNKKVKAKIGIMYLHDYYLAYDNTSIWLGKYDDSNWILFANNENTINCNREWLLTSVGNIEGQYKTIHQFFVYDDGHVDSTEPLYPYVVRPCFYLNNDIQLLGKGTKEEPYRLSLN